MPTSIITTEDLQEFKKELLQEIQSMLTEQKNQNPKKWLKSNEVLKLLKISPGTLQNLKFNGTLPYTKLGGIIYFDSDEIQRLMVEKKVLH
ncbi:helix-turn-helix domain-containing protein [Salinimicrobium sp. TIG7-5_MAKvit]|uniref:helix-turn-helix domain-containing protein n=1 Tax=Salinimicrobium sp. TIG7-5_MAKvit TaxID=3121289 RepID=UPI003C6E4816